MPIDTLNRYLVGVIPGVSSEQNLISVLLHPTMMTREEALGLAAYLVVLADASRAEFDEYLTAVQNT